VPGRTSARPAAWLWRRNWLAWLLWPVSLVFCTLVRLRVWLYRIGWLPAQKLPVTVLVVGNISLGGNGKTPVVASLVQILRQHGYHPAILTRGYRSDYESSITLLQAGEVSERAGDEANMLSQQCACPIAVGANRVAAGRALLQHDSEVDIIITDDGLQHYALARDLEIIVQRTAANGNGFCLPAGPLREPRSRLLRADLVIDRDGDDIHETFGQCWNLLHPQQRQSLSGFRAHRLYALAGIGFPELFFDALRREGLDIEPHGFPDHYDFNARDLIGLDDAPLLVTHKDAVKLQPFATDNIWVVPLELTLSDDLQYRLFTVLEKKHHG